MTHAETTTSIPTPGPAPAAARPAKVMTILVSERACAEIEKMQQKRMGEGKPRAPGLRVGIRGGGCTGFGYLFEWSDGDPRKTDKVFEFPLPSGGEPIRIFCDPKSLIYLDGTTLDFVTSVMGHGFKFVNPNVKGACGCGESVQF